MTRNQNISLGFTVQKPAYYERALILKKKKQ
jgi:hypothetical protein